MLIHFRILGSPRTKKNSNRLVRTGFHTRVLPSLAHERWYEATQDQAFAIKADLRHAGIELPITERLTVGADFYRERNYQADECGYMQALGDWLQGVGMIQNDSQIHWGGVSLLVDRKQPRIEVRIERDRSA